jgi:hypothetical protein
MLQLAGWIFILAGSLNVVASLASKSPLFAVAGMLLFVAAILFFISSNKAKKQD